LYFFKEIEKIIENFRKWGFGHFLCRFGIIRPLSSEKKAKKFNLNDFFPSAHDK